MAHAPADDLLTLPVREFLERLASRAPAPGGGAAAALAGAMSAALGAMAAEYTLGPAKYAAVAERITRLRDQLAEARQLALALLAEDAAAYAALAAAFKAPREEPARPARIAAAAQVAAAVPLQVAGLAAALLPLLRELGEIGNANLRPDVESATHLARAAARCAAENVRANLPLLPAEPRDEMARELDGLLLRCGCIPN